MNDIALYTLIYTQFNAGVMPRILATWPNLHNEIDILRGNQPQQQGRPDTILAVRFWKVFDKRIGSRKIREYWNATTSQMMRETIQWYETTIQVDAYAPAVTTPDQTDLNPTAGDILRAAADALTDPDWIATLAAQKVGVQRITQADPNWIENDKDQFEDVPHFTVTFSHPTTYTAVINSMQYGPLEIYRV
jgi:hypothetical protein